MEPEIFVSPSSQAPSPHSCRVEEQGALPAPIPLHQPHGAGVQLLLLRGRMCLQWGSGRFCGGSWDGRAVLPPGKGLGCLEKGSRSLRCCTGVGLLDAVELCLFVKERVLHSVLTSSLELLSSSSQEKLANPSHAMSLCQATSCLLSPHTLPPGFCIFQEGEEHGSHFTQSL